MIKRIGLLFKREEKKKILRAGMPMQKRHKLRDSKLEHRARTAILPLAPELATRIVVGWNSRMRTTAGIADPSVWEIWLNPALREISDQEVERTLLHELAHLLAHYRHPRRRIQPHGMEWRAACHDLGIGNESRTHQLPFRRLRMKSRYLMRCPVCGQSHERVHPPKRRVACLACCRLHHGGRYHERFRLEIVEK